MKMIRSAKTMLNLLAKNGYDAYLVGGAARDAIMERSGTKDVDICTNAKPDVVYDIFKYYGIESFHPEFGTLSFKFDGLNFDITTYRVDEEYSKDCYPTKLHFTTDAAVDVRRRDFTINSILIDHNLNIVDYYNGREDLFNNVLRCIGEPDDRFTEDPTRILRAIRFKIKYKYEIEEATLASMYANSVYLKNAKGKLFRKELLKILELPHAYENITEFKDILIYAMPIFDLNEKLNRFSNPLFKLAYLIDDADEYFYERCHFSNKEILFLRNLSRVKQMSLKNNKNFSSFFVDSDYDHDTLLFLNSLHKRNLSEKYQKNIDYIVDEKTLDVTAEDLNSCGYFEPHLKRIKLVLCIAIRKHEIRNKKEEIINYLKH